ncbi:MAG: ATP-binding protein [bacterium]|nr:ATP-binding protein [bacterium]
MFQSIKIKLITSFFAIIIILIISSGFHIIMNSIIIQRYAALMDNMVSEYKIIGASTNFIESFKTLIKYSNDQKKMDQFDVDRSELQALLNRLNANIVDYNTKVAFFAVANTVNDLIFEIDQGTEDILAGNFLNITDHYDACNKKNAFIKENTANLLLNQLEFAKNLQAEIDRVRGFTQLISLLLFIVVGTGCIWYALVFSKELVTPLSHLTKLAKTIESGDLTATVDEKLLKGGDEVASLANSFNTMVFFLRSNIQKLQEYNLEIKNSRNHLKSEKNKLQQYLDVAGVVVLIFDVNNNTLLINKKGREILKIKADEIMGKNWVSLFVKPTDQAKTRSLLNFLVGNITPVDTLENVLVAKDKSEKNIVWHFSVLKSESNVSQAILGTGVDVTELTAAKVTIHQLKEVDRFKNEVLNIATHELKTPLISIVGLSEVMVKQPKTMPAEYQNFIALIHAEGLKLTNLIKTMLTASRDEIGRTAVVIEKFVFDELILSMATSLGVLAKQSNSQVVFDIQAKGINMESDKIKISQVVYNFVDNAVKYGPKNQTITVSMTKPSAQTVRLAVSGAGQGIPKEKQPGLFLKFSQLEPSLSRSQDGLGLGLYICKQNIDGLGGEIGVISEVSQGATFFFTLPLVYTAPLTPFAALAAKASASALAAAKSTAAAAPVIAKVSAKNKK